MRLEMLWRRQLERKGLLAGGSPVIEGDRHLWGTMACWQPALRHRQPWGTTAKGDPSKGQRAAETNQQKACGSRKKTIHPAWQTETKSRIFCAWHPEHLMLADMNKEAFTPCYHSHCKSNPVQNSLHSPPWKLHYSLQKLLIHFQWYNSSL